MDQLNPYLSIFLTQFLYIVLPVLATLLAALCVQGLRWLEGKIKAERPDIFKTLQFLASAAVQAAEQAKIAGLISDKKVYAIGLITEQLNTLGLTIDVQSIEGAIETAVFAEINKDKITK
jgi:LL-H family phage holin